MAQERPRSGAAARRTYPPPEARGGGREKQPHLQGAVAARAQEGLEEAEELMLLNCGVGEDS